MSSLSRFLLDKGYLDNHDKENDCAIYTMKDSKISIRHFYVPWPINQMSCEIEYRDDDHQFGTASGFLTLKISNLTENQLMINYDQYVSMIEKMAKSTHY